MRLNEATPLSSQATASPSMMHERARKRANVSTISGKVASHPAGRGAYFARVQFANSVHMAPHLRELIALSLLAGLGFGLAFARGDVIFVGVFGAACAMAIIGGTQRFP